MTCTDSGCLDGCAYLVPRPPAPWLVRKVVAKLRDLRADWGRLRFEVLRGCPPSCDPHLRCLNASEKKCVEDTVQILPKEWVL